MHEDLESMRRAIALARRGLGRVSPNPPVGCVIVREGRIVGEGWHERCGGPHAEPLALAAAGDGARGATAFVTLMPCAHHGRTPPCTRALLDAGIARVVVALDDPHPVSGDGAAELRAAGVPVEIGLCAAEAAEGMRGFLKHCATGLPFVTWKGAASLDGKTATRTGDSRWISGEESRARVHRLRAESDAILVGIGTALADDPRLDARVEDAPQPRRVVADPACRLPTTARLLQPPGGPVLILAGPAAPANRVEALRKAGAEVEILPGADGRPTPRELLAALAARGIRTVLLEGGATLAGTFFDAGLIDEALLFIAPLLIGGADAPGLLGGLGVARLADAVRLRPWAWTPVGSDLLLHAPVGDRPWMPAPVAPSAAEDCNPTLPGDRA